MVCEILFRRFKSQRRFRSGRPSKVDNDVLRFMSESNPHLTTRAIAIHHSTAEENSEFILKQSIWVPHNLIEENFSHRVRICSSLWMRHKAQPFLDKLITGDENIKRKKNYCKLETSSSIIAKPNLHQRKVILFLWWNRKAPLCYELFKQGQTINAIAYCNQLDKLNAAINEKRPVLAKGKGIIFHHDNTKPHTALVTQQKLNELGGKFLVLHHIHLT